MKTILKTTLLRLVLAIPLCLASPLLAQSAEWPVDDAGLKTLAQSLMSSWAKSVHSQDWSAIDTVLDPNSQRLTFEGAFDKASQIEAIKSLSPATPQVSDVVASRVGDALVVTCLAKVASPPDGPALSSDPTPRLVVWQLTDGSWHVAAWASLNMPAKRPAPQPAKWAGDAALNAQGEAMVMKFLQAQHAKEIDAFDAMIADGMQFVNFKGQKLRADMVKGAKMATTDSPAITDTRTTRCGTLTVVTCNLAMGQKIGFTTLPASPAPFMVVFQGEGDAAKVIAIANTNKPE